MYVASDALTQHCRSGTDVDDAIRFHALRPSPCPATTATSAQHYAGNVVDLPLTAPGDHVVFAWFDAQRQWDASRTAGIVQRVPTPTHRRAVQ